LGRVDQIVRIADQGTIARHFAARGRRDLRAGPLGNSRKCEASKTEIETAAADLHLIVLWLLVALPLNRKDDKMVAAW
jgi:hypothetical protein